MSNTHIKKHSTNRLVKELLLAQSQQERDQRKRFKKLQKLLGTIHRQLEQLITIKPETTQDNMTSTDSKGHTKRKTRKVGKVSTAISRATPTIDTEQEQASDNSYESDNKTNNDNDDDDDDNETMIPWPRYVDDRGRSFRKYEYNISKHAVMTTLRKHLLPHVTLDFGDNSDDNQARASSSSNQQQQLEQRTFHLFDHVANHISNLCDQEPPKHVSVSRYTQLSTRVATRLINRLERNLDRETIRIARAEDHWLAKFFVTRCLKIKNK